MEEKIIVEQIESSTVLRKRLGEHINTIKQLDPLPKERDRTKHLKKKLLKQYDPRCGYCDKQSKVVAAHLIPLEIGACTTEENLILLCLSCHKLYDNGYMSINAMSKVAEEWRKRITLDKPRRALVNIQTPKPSIAPPPHSVQDAFETILPLQRERKYHIASNLIKKRLKDDKINKAGRICLKIKLAEITRRRSGGGVVKRALHYLNQINQIEVPTEYQPVFYYEFAYVHRLLGNHAEAAQILRVSADKLMRQSRGGVPLVDYITASVNEILCQMAKLEKITMKHAEDFERKLNEMEAIANKNGKYWGGRWALNCAIHTLQVQLRAGNKNKSWNALERLRDLFFNSDLENGWDIAGRQTFSLLDGLVRVHFPRTEKDLDKGIGLLARSLVSRLGNRQRPEGIRDAGFGLAKGLRKKDNNKMNAIADQIELLMHRTVDGTSVLWPSRIM